MAKHTPSIPTPYHQPADDYGGIEAGVSRCPSDSDRRLKLASEWASWSECTRVLSVLFGDTCVSNTPPD